MHSTLRKMGNSTGLIVPNAVLRAAGVESGTVLDLTIEDGRIVASPVRAAPRAGWAESAAEVAAAPPGPDEAAWMGLANDGGAERTLRSI